MIEKYSKTSGFYRSVKSDLFEANAKLVADSASQNILLNEQTVRQKCRVCRENRQDQANDFKSQNVQYWVCRFCNHFNSDREDTLEFAKALYLQSSTSGNYGKAYLGTAFSERVDEIYVPKAKFLKECLPEFDVDILDIGAGMGHFVAACWKEGLPCIGIEPSDYSVSQGNRLLLSEYGKSGLVNVDLEQTEQFISRSKANVISAIGVLEHITDLDGVMEQLTSQSNAKYLYYSVPMMSLATVMGVLFPGLYSRILSGGHTHLFSEPSIKKFNDMWDLKPVGMWRFGADILDLTRALEFILTPVSSDTFLNNFMEHTHEVVDGLQAVLDKAHWCSEIHVLAEIQRP